MKTGDRVVILRGQKARGTQGTVIWYGVDRFDEEGERQRVGIQVEGQAEPVFVNAAHVEVIEPAPASVAAKSARKPARKARAKKAEALPIPSLEGRNLDLERTLLEDPDDRSRYAVYGDWLQERGDRRGELIAAQLAADEDGKHQPLAKKLLEEYEKAMRDRIPALKKKAGALVPRPFTWRWGFVEKMKVHDIHLGFIAALLAEPELLVVQELDLATTCHQMNDLSLLAGARALRRLDLSYNPIVDLSPSNLLPELRWLRCWTRSLAELPELRGLRHLEVLELDDTRVREVGNLAGLESLSDLGLAGTSLLEVESFPALPRLKKLSLAKTVIKDVSPLASRLPALEVLSLANTLCADLTELGSMTSLKVLELNASKVTDLEPLRGLTRLERLNLALTEVRDLSPIAALPNLKELYLAKAPIPGEQLSALRQARPALKLDTRYTFR